MSGSPWHDRFLGLSRLPARLSDGELAEFFTLSDEDVAAIGAQFRPKYRIAAGIQLGFIRMTGGRLAALKTLPRNLLSFIGRQVGEPAPTIASLRSLYRRQNTRYAHQAWAMQRLHITAVSSRQERHLFADLKEASKTTASRERLMGFARQWLYERKLLVPRDSTLRDLVDRAARETEKAIYAVMCDAVSASKRAEWFKVLMADHRDGRTVLEWLQRAPQRRMQKNFRDLTDKIQFLRKLGVDKVKLPGVPQERLAQYALALQHRKPSRFRTMATVNRTLFMVAFLKVTLGRIADVVIDLANKKTSDIFAGALRAVQKAEGATI